MNGMETVPYAITPKAPASARRLDYDLTAKRGYLSAVRLRSLMRCALHAMIDQYDLPTELEFQLFGELTPDGFAKPSAFRVSDALN